MLHIRKIKFKQSLLCSHTCSLSMPIPGPHKCLLWLVMRCNMRSMYDLRNYPVFEQGHIHAWVLKHTNTHTPAGCACTLYTHTRYFKANSSETREDRPPCVQVTEWITCRAKMLASCLSEQHWMAFRWILQSLVQTLSQYWGNGQSWRMNNSEVILGGNVCLGHFTLQSCQSVVRSLAHSQHRLHLQHLTAQLHNYS